MEQPERDPKKRPEALFALRHWAYLTLLQCDRLSEAALAQGAVSQLPKHNQVRDEARHLVLGERFLLLCAGREMVRAINALQMGRLPGAMHDDLRLFRDALSHWNGWGTGQRAEVDILRAYPDEWPFRVEMKNGDVFLGGSLKTSDVQKVAGELYAWTRNPAMGHPLVDVPVDPHTHAVVLDVGSHLLGAVEAALKEARFATMVRNLLGKRDIMVLLESPEAAATVEAIARTADPDVAVAPVIEFSVD